LPNLRNSLRREKNTAGLLGALITLSGAIEETGKIASGIRVLPKLSARNVKLNARFPLGPPETVQYTAKIVFQSVETEKEFLQENTAVPLEEESRLSANAAETAHKKNIPSVIAKAGECPKQSRINFDLKVI